MGKNRKLQLYNAKRREILTEVRIGKDRDKTAFAPIFFTYPFYPAHPALSATARYNAAASFVLCAILAAVKLAAFVIAFALIFPVFVLCLTAPHTIYLLLMPLTPCRYLFSHFLSSCSLELVQLFNIGDTRADGLSHQYQSTLVPSLYAYGIPSTKGLPREIKLFSRLTVRFGGVRAYKHYDIRYLAK